MYCLSDVMKFFLSTVGPTARPLCSAVGSTRLVPTHMWSIASQPDDVNLHNQTGRGCLLRMCVIHSSYRYKLCIIIFVFVFLFCKENVNQFYCRFAKAFCVSVRPILEYASVIWNTHYKNQISKIEGVQLKTELFVQSYS